MITYFLNSKNAVGYKCQNLTKIQAGNTFAFTVLITKHAAKKKTLFDI